MKSKIRLPLFLQPVVSEPPTAVADLPETSVAEPTYLLFAHESRMDSREMKPPVFDPLDVCACFMRVGEREFGSRF